MKFKKRELISVSKRILFFILMVMLLFLPKLFISFQMNHYIIFPDEFLYGTIPESITDISVYSIIPFLFDYHTVLAFNCLITSLCFIPIFYLLRKHKSERDAAILATLISLISPFWAFSLVNMTEALLFLTCLTLIQYKWFSWIPVGVKPMGLASFLAQHNYGVIVALGIGIFAITRVDYNNFGLANAISCLGRSLSYLIIGSALTFIILAYKAWNGLMDGDDHLIFNFTLCTFAIILPMAFFIPANVFYGRYFDLPIMLSLTTIFKPVEKSKQLKLWLVAGAIFAVVFLALNFKSFNPILDSGIFIFTDVIKKAIEIGH